MHFFRSLKPAVATTAVIAAIAPKDLNIDDPCK
jgi:mannan endo-1,6-alpha-mannosidase